jgi:hypothetical protein
MWTVVGPTELGWHQQDPLPKRLQVAARTRNIQRTGASVSQWSAVSP